MKTLPAIHLKILLIICFLLSGSGDVVAQHYNFRVFDREDGLPSSYVLDVMQDAQGYMWFITSNGICRYDGKEFKWYGSKEGFKDVGGYRIFRDKQDNMWFISFNWNLYLLEGDRLRLHSENIQWLDTDDNGRLFAASRSGKLFHMTTAGSKEFEDFGGTIYYVKKLKNGAFIVTLTTKVIYYKDGKSTVINIHKNIINIIRVYELSDGRVIMCNYAGIYSFDPLDMSVRMIIPLINNNEIHGFYQDTVTKDVWLTTLKGTYRFKNGKISIENKETFFDVICGSVYKSKDGAMWITSFGAGVFYSKMNSVHYTKADGLKADGIFRIGVQDGQIYTITKNTALSTINGKEVRTVNFRESGAPLVHFAPVSNGPLYFSTSLMHFWKIEGGKVERFKLPAYGNIKVEENDIVDFDPAHNIFCHVASHKISISYNPDKRSFTVQPKIISDFYTRWNKKFGFGKIILLTDKKEYYYKIRNGVIKMELVNDSVYYEVDSAYEVTPNDVVFTAANSMVVASQNRGLAIVKNGVHHFYNASSGLAGNNISRVYYDSGYVWAISYYGLSRLTLDKNDLVSEIVNFNSGNLLISNEVNDVAFFGDDVYVATNKGISVFKKSFMPSKQYAPPVYIQYLQVNNKDIPLLNQMELPWDENNISIRFRALSFTGENLIYKYQLEGAENAFQQSSENNIKYAALPPGNYTFKVFARTESGEWNKTPAIMSFSILPPFWKTWWFIAAAGSLLLLILIFSVRRIIWVNRKREEIKRKMIESELKAIRLHMNPHFIYNTLNSLQSFILSNKAIEANNYLAVFSKLVRLIMHYAQLKEIPLQEEIEFLNMYVELEQMRFDQKFAFMIETAEDIDTASVFIPPLVIQPFIENAIKHGLSGKKGKGRLSLRLKKEEGFLYCIIEDDGIGRKEAEEIKRKSVSTFEPTGISFTVERLRLLSDRKDIFKVLDLYNSEGKPAGTRIDLFIPLND